MRARAICTTLTQTGIIARLRRKKKTNAAATIFWDNAFSEEGRVPYHVPERVIWARFIEALDYKWQAEIRTKIYILCII